MTEMPDPMLQYMRAAAARLSAELPPGYTATWDDTPLVVPVVTDADLSAMRQAADTAGLFMRTIAAQLRPVMEEISKAVAEFMRIVGRPDFERRSRLRRMHTEYRRRTRRSVHR